jgi:hypothetical protein
MCRPINVFMKNVCFLIRKKQNWLTPRCICQMIFDKRHEGLSRNWLSANDGFIPRCVDHLLCFSQMFVCWKDMDICQPTDCQQNAAVISWCVGKLFFDKRHGGLLSNGNEATVNRALDGSMYPLVHSVLVTINYGGLKHNSLYLGLVLSSGGWQILIDCQQYCISAKCLLKRQSRVVTPRCTCQMVFDKRHGSLSRNWL